MPPVPTPSVLLLLRTTLPSFAAVVLMLLLLMILRGSVFSVKLATFLSMQYVGLGVAGMAYALALVGTPVHFFIVVFLRELGLKVPPPDWPGWQVCCWRFSVIFVLQGVELALVILALRRLALPG